MVSKFSGLWYPLAGRFDKTTVVANAYYSKCHLMEISYQSVECAFPLTVMIA